MEFWKYLLLWKDDVIQSVTNSGTYSLYKNGKLEFSNQTGTICLLDRKGLITQNQKCGEFDETEMKKALCQYHFLFNQELPSDLILTFTEVDDHELWSMSSHNGLVAESKFGTYFLENNGRVVFHGDHKNYRADSKRLIHQPNSTKIKSPYGFKPIDIKKAVCFRHNLDLLIKEELHGNINLWDSSENLVKNYLNTFYQQL